MLLRTSLHLLLLSALWSLPANIPEVARWPDWALILYALLTGSGVIYSYLRHGSAKLPPYRFTFPRRRTSPRRHSSARPWSHYQKVQ